MWFIIGINSVIHFVLPIFQCKYLTSYEGCNILIEQLLQEGLRKTTFATISVKEDINNQTIRRKKGHGLAIIISKTFKVITAKKYEKILFVFEIKDNAEDS